MAWWLRNLLCALLQGIFRDYILQVFGFIGGLGSAFFPSSAEVGSFVVKIINAIIFIVIALAGWGVGFPVILVCCNSAAVWLPLDWKCSLVRQEVGWH